MKLDKTFAELWAEKEIKNIDKEIWRQKFIDHVIFDRDYTITKDDSYTRVEHLTVDEVIEKYSWTLTDEQIKLLKDDRDNTPQI